MSKKFLSDTTFESNISIDKICTLDEHAATKGYVDTAIYDINKMLFNSRTILDKDITLNNQYEDDNKTVISSQELVFEIPYDDNINNITSITVVINGIIYFEDCFTYTVIDNQEGIRIMAINWDFKNIFIIDKSFNITVKYDL